MRSSGLSLDQAPPEDIPFRFFLTAPVFGLLAGSLILYRGVLVFSSSWHFETIALTHLITLGWVMMIMMGAFYQLVPVLAGGQVPWIALSRAVHFFMIIGILALAGGLIQISQLLFPVAISALLLAFTVFPHTTADSTFQGKSKSACCGCYAYFADLTGTRSVTWFTGNWCNYGIVATAD